MTAIIRWPIGTTAVAQSARDLRCFADLPRTFYRSDGRWQVGCALLMKQAFCSTSETDLLETWSPRAAQSSAVGRRVVVAAVVSGEPRTLVADRAARARGVGFPVAGAAMKIMGRRGRRGCGALEAVEIRPGCPMDPIAFFSHNTLFASVRPVCRQSHCL
jgi:hypothetical protein